MGGYELRLQNNHFTRDLSRLINMILLDDSDHEVRTDFPSVFNLSNNDLLWSTSELIPDPIQAVLGSLTNFPDSWLTEFWVGGKKFPGTSLPKTCFINATAYDRQYPLQVLDLSNSHLNGEISAALDNSCLSLLRNLNLSNNNITGVVP